MDGLKGQLTERRINRIGARLHIISIHLTWTYFIHQFYATDTMDLDSWDLIKLQTDRIVRSFLGKYYHQSEDDFWRGHTMETIFTLLADASIKQVMEMIGWEACLWWTVIFAIGNSYLPQTKQEYEFLYSPFFVLLYNPYENHFPNTNQPNRDPVFIELLNTYKLMQYTDICPKGKHRKQDIDILTHTSVLLFVWMEDS
jgi:hypothetical protein